MNNGQTFAQYKHAHEGPFRIQDEQTRVLVATLVSEFKRFHLMGTVPHQVNPHTVLVINGEAILQTEPLVYTRKKALERFRALATFLHEDVFNEVEQTPCFTNFLDLLRERTSPDDVNLIFQHYGIQPSSMRLTFINNIMLVPKYIGHRERVEVYKVFDGVEVRENWNELFHGDPFFDSVFYYQKMTPDYLGREVVYEYETSCPYSRSSALFRFLRNCYSHLKDYNEEKLGPFKDYQTLLSQIDQMFETELTRVQEALYRAGFLDYFGMNPAANLPM